MFQEKISIKAEYLKESPTSAKQIDKLGRHLLKHDNDAGGYDRPTWSITSTSVHHFTCGQAYCAHDSDGSLSDITNHSKRIEFVTHHSVSARTIRRRLQQSGLSARRPLLGLPLT
ncbi:transposable element Tcb1 transposase [Trichonephila clavipes]|nr:transposable element Tcb1 transposase [Trichonephila clavipes]